MDFVKLGRPSNVHEMIRIRPSRAAPRHAPGLCLVVAIAWLAPAAAQTPPPLRPALSDPPAQGQAAPDALRQRDRELEAARAEQRKAIETERKLRQEIEALGADRRRLNQQLIDTAARVRAVETRITEAESRLTPLDDAERGIRASLDDRSALIAEVLAALQRIGRRPPPAVMVRPEDALQAVRSAITLGAVLPEIRAEAEALAGDLADLLRVRKEIADERDRLARDFASLSDERTRMNLLVEGRQQKEAEAQKALEAERQRATQLGRQVDNLKDLIGKLEQSLDSSTRAARAAARAADDDKFVAESRPQLAALKDPGRLAPAVAFGSARGLLPLPVNGVRIRSFGTPDSLGSTEKGLSIATRAAAQVTSPCDGWVVYAGPFRSYGQLLILNAGGGYHVLLAGMERISVDIGQFVLTGEPVAAMGSGSQVAATVATGFNQPVLYVEFRKDGTPIDPGPWWATSEGEKVRG
jgi:septal ring factor EnvC (AmiA/AmiB activator)